MLTVKGGAVELGRTAFVVAAARKAPLAKVSNAHVRITPPRCIVDRGRFHTRSCPFSVAHKCDEWPWLAVSLTLNLNSARTFARVPGVERRNYAGDLLSTGVGTRAGRCDDHAGYTLRTVALR